MHTIGVALSTLLLQPQKTGIIGVRNLFVAANHIHLKQCGGVFQEKGRSLNIVTGAQKPPLFRVPGRKENRSGRFFRAQGIGLSNLQQTRRTTGIVIGTLENFAIVITHMIEMSADDHHLILQIWIRTG